MVLEQNEHNIKLTQENDLFVISVTAGENVIWTADIDAHPVPQVTWYDNRNQEIVKSSPKFNITNNEKAATIQISHVSINERGNFTLKATNVESKNLTFFLNVTGTARLLQKTTKTKLKWQLLFLQINPPWRSRATITT